MGWRTHESQAARLPSRCNGVRCHSFRAFGLAVESDFALPGIAQPRGEESAPRVTLRLVSHAELETSWTGHLGPPVWETVLGDGIPIRQEIGLVGDHRITYGSATFHISPDAHTVLCAPQDALAAGWQRQLLDTILFSVSFLNGFELLHASAVECDAGVVAFVARSGGGKSTIVAELLRRGHRLFCDDVLAIGPSSDGLTSHPGPAVMNLPAAAMAPEELGASVIAPFPKEDELWVALPTAATEPRPVVALYLLDRGADRSAVSAVAPTPLVFLPHAISLPHDPERARRRFRAFSTLADGVSVWRLSARPSDDPAALADLVEGSLGAAQARLPVVAG